MSINDNIYIEPPYVVPEPPASEEPPATETRDALNYNGDVIGTLTLIAGTSEEEWAEKLAHFTYVPPIKTLDQIIDASLQSATDFGAEMIQKFKVQNIKSGITQMNKTKAVSDYLHWMNHYLEQGSLYAAIQQIDIYLSDVNRSSLSLEPFITDAILNEYKRQISAYLGI